VQINVKHVPIVCVVGDVKDKKFYPYTAIDEYSRFRYLEAFEQASTYTYTLFLEHMLKTFKFEIEFVQSDNSFEFTKRFGGDKNPPTLFEQLLKQRSIRHKFIRPFSTRHNGKVECSHHKSNDYFYASHSFYSSKDFNTQLAIHRRSYNAFPMRPLKWQSPKKVLHDFFALV